MERSSSRSKPRRLGISSRKSVSAEARSSSIRASACANWPLSRRTASLASLGGTDSRGEEAGAFTSLARRGAALRAATTFLRRFAPLEAVALVFFFINILEKACRDSPRQDSPFPPPCHALPKLGPIL